MRVELGISVRVAAKLAGVARNTLDKWEAAPNAVEPAQRAKCEQLYRLLRLVLRRAPGAARAKA